MAACGGNAGVLLDVQTGDPSIASVEVFVAKSQVASRMGVPPGGTARPVQGSVYEVIDHTAASVGGDGRVRVLLERGDVTDVPAILVLGLDANNTPTRYAVVTDPSGSITLPATHEVRLVVELQASTGTSVAMARMPAGNAGTRIARWSSESRGSDDPKGACVALLDDASANAVQGTFFGPAGDTDCDAAQPECDDAWYLRVKDPGKCATDTAPNVATLDACRIGDSAGCRDGIASSDNACVPQIAPPVCVPAPICKQCSDLDPSCVQQQLFDPNTMHLACTLYVHAEMGASMLTLCGNRQQAVDMSGLFGGGYACTGSAGFVNPMMPMTMVGADIPLASAMGPRVTFACHNTTTSFVLDVTDPTAAPIMNNMDTHGAVLVSVAVPGDAASTRVLVVPITVSLNDVGNGTCPTEGMSCAYVTAQSVDDPLWHCAGS